MRYTLVALFSLVALSACVPSETSEANQDNRALAEAGHRVAQLKCARCHAVELSGESRNQNAPPFREISRSLTIMSNETSFREGVRIGHMDMPPVRLTRSEIEALSAYLHTLQS